MSKAKSLIISLAFVKLVQPIGELAFDGIEMIEGRGVSVTVLFGFIGPQPNTRSTAKLTRKIDVYCLNGISFMSNKCLLLVVPNGRWSLYDYLYPKYSEFGKVVAPFGTS